MRIAGKVKQKASLLRALPMGVIVPALLLCACGVSFILSATTDFEMVAEGVARPGGQHFRQLGFAIAGVLLMLFIALLPPRWLSTHWYAWLALGVALLGSVLVFGRTAPLSTAR